jgi:hypothetical protein
MIDHGMIGDGAGVDQRQGLFRFQDVGEIERDLHAGRKTCIGLVVTDLPEPGIVAREKCDRRGDRRAIECEAIDAHLALAGKRRHCLGHESGGLRISRNRPAGPALPTVRFDIDEIGERRTDIARFTGHVVIENTLLCKAPALAAKFLSLARRNNIQRFVAIGNQDRPGMNGEAADGLALCRHMQRNHAGGDARLRQQWEQRGFRGAGKFRQYFQHGCGRFARHIAVEQRRGKRCEGMRPGNKNRHGPCRSPSFNASRQEADQLCACIDRDRARIARPNPLKSGVRKTRLKKYVRLDRPPRKIAPWSRIGREIRKRRPAYFELSVPETERDGVALEHCPRGRRISASVFSRFGD